MREISTDSGTIFKLSIPMLMSLILEQIIGLTDIIFLGRVSEVSVGAAAIGGVIIQQAMGTIVDILKVQFAVQDFEAVPGLPESVFATEGFAFLNDVLFSGILFCLLPTLFLVPKLYGKIEPLLGMQPRTAETALEPISGKVILGSLAAFAVAIGAEMLAESGMSLIDWEADWAESTTALAVGMVVAAVIAVVAILVIKVRSNGSDTAKTA